MDALVMASLIFYGLIISFGSYWNAFSRENCFYRDHIARSGQDEDELLWFPKPLNPG